MACRQQVLWQETCREALVSDRMDQTEKVSKTDRKLIIEGRQQHSEY